jgi:hypothetical protein
MGEGRDDEKEGEEVRIKCSQKRENGIGSNETLLQTVRLRNTR